MVKVGSVVAIFYSTVNKRTRTSKLMLDKKGIIKDKHYDENIDRSILLASLESYELASQNMIDISYGALGENILLDYNPYHLLLGSKLQIGGVILEITQHCTLCKSFSKIDTKLPKLLKDDRGIFAKVIEMGEIEEGNDIYLLS